LVEGLEKFLSGNSYADQLFKMNRHVGIRVLFSPSSETFDEKPTVLSQLLKLFLNLILLALC
jgi:hypothetical protein